MHLAYELNRMIPVQFISTDGKASDREALLALLETGVTYILDRGYLAFDLFQKIIAHNAFFIHFKQTLIEEKGKEQKESCQPTLLNSLSHKKPSLRRKQTRLPEYGLVSLLRSRIKKL
jgi:hypothetical protein